MTTLTNRRRILLALFAVALSAGLSGCRSTGSGGSGEGRPPSGGLGILGGDTSGVDGKGDARAMARNRDPILGRRIPKQNLPVTPGHDDGAYGSTEGLPADPLFRHPLRPKASVPRPNEVGSRVPFRPGPDVTSAALAMAPRSDGNELVIDDRRPRGTPTAAGPVPLRPAENPTPTASILSPKPAAASMVPAAGSAITVEMMTEELRKIGARPYAPVRLTNGDYEFRCALPINDAGAMRSYTGTGATPVAAVRSVYEQIRNEK